MVCVGINTANGLVAENLFFSRGSLLGFVGCRV
jgi:hypothetical protein